MAAPRLEIDFGKIQQNARALVKLLGIHGIAVTAVTKATLGSPEIARALLAAGVTGLADSRIENIEVMRRAGVAAAMTLLRSPMLSEIERVVAHADVSLNSEIVIIRALSCAARRARTTHGIVLMVELGDLREGIMPGDLEDAARETLGCPNLVLKGIGANLACHSGVSPSAKNMGQLSTLADSLEAALGVRLAIVSGGNSANLDWVRSGACAGRINDLRLGESILLGREPLHRRPIGGLHTDAITLVAEVIESKVKPSQPWGDLAQAAFGEAPATRPRGDVSQMLLAVGRQDTDPWGLRPPVGVEIVGASSDHLIVHAAGHPIPVGAEVAFQLNYCALMRAMTSPFVGRAVTAQQTPGPLQAAPFPERKKAPEAGVAPGAMDRPSP